jgi:peptide/nickel transport system substrate-binding protein
MKSLLIVAASGTLALALTLVACGSGGSSGGASGSQNLADGKPFTMALGGDPGNLDPHFTSLSVTMAADRFLYDSLLNIDEKGGLVAGLADKWTGTTTKATFTLRKGITCSDGTPLTAGDVAANISFVGDPKNASTRAGVFVPAGAKATADDAAGTVTVTSATADAFLTRNLGELQIVCHRGMKDRGLLKQGADGTGMYTLTEAVSGDHYTLTRRKDYAWGPGAWTTGQHGLPDRVVLKVVTNETTAANLLLSRQVNAAALVGPDKQRLKAAKTFERDASLPLGELWFNQKAGFPGADEAVRRALTQALDLGQLGQVLTSGTGRPATGLVPLGMGPCNQNTIGSNLPTHDANAATSALDTAGWTAGADGVRAKAGRKLSVALYYPTAGGQGMQAGAELMQKVWKSIGVSVTLKSVTDTETGSQIAGGQAAWNAAILPLGITLPSEAVSFLSGPTPPGGNNFAGIKNAEYAAGVKAASATVGTDGCGKWAEAEAALYRHVDLVPFVNTVIPTFAQGARFELSEGSVLPGSIRMLG